MKQLLILFSLLLASAPARADMGLLVMNQPLSQTRLQQLGASAQDYETRSQYGLIDHNSQSRHYFELDSQRDGLMQEMLNHQASGHLSQIKGRVEQEAPNSILLKSTVLLGSAYMFYNGKTFTTRVSENTEVSGNAKVSAGTHALNVTRKNISPLGFNSGVGYQTDSNLNPYLNATLSKEIFPHVVATVGQKKALTSSPESQSESTGQIRFGTSF